MKKISQKQAVFYKLYKEWLKDDERYVPAWEFVGEIKIEPFDSWFLMSYKCPTRLTDIYQENPDIIERDLIIGKSGAYYYGYRLKNPLDVKLIKDHTLFSFFEKIHKNEQHSYIAK